MDPPSISHRSMLYNYTYEVSHIEKCTYTMVDGPHPIDHRSMLFNYTHKVSHIEKCTYTHCRWVADGRSMLHNYTQKVSHIEELAYTHDRWTPLIDHRSRLHHDRWTPLIDHRSRLHPKSFTYRRMHIYLWQMDSPHSSIDPCNTTPPNEFHI